MAAVIADSDAASSDRHLSDDDASNDNRIIGQDELLQRVEVINLAVNDVIMEDDHQANWDADEFNEQLQRNMIDLANEDENWGLDPQDEDEDNSEDDLSDSDWEAGEEDDDSDIISIRSVGDVNAQQQPQQRVDNPIQMVGLGVYPPPLDDNGRNLGRRISLIRFLFTWLTSFCTSRLCPRSLQNFPSLCQSLTGHTSLALSFR